METGEGSGPAPTRAHPLRPLVVVPTFNEADNVDAVLDGILGRAPQAEVLFVDDASPDGTADHIERRRSGLSGKVHLIRRRAKLGLGGAYLAGFEWGLAQGHDALVEMDADLSHDPAEVPRLLDLLRHHDCVIGSRRVAGGGIENWGLARRLISCWGNLYARSLLALPVLDPTSGFVAWRAEVFRDLDLASIRSEGYAFQVELKLRAHLIGLSLHETPIRFSERRVGRSKLSWRDILEAAVRVPALCLARRSIAARRASGG